jgi:replicative DNA helicase
MADIELELLSRAIMTGGISDVIADGVEPRHFYDPDARAVYETCVEHYSLWRRPLSLEAVKRHHPDYKIVPSTDELGYLIKEFRQDRGVKTGLSAVLDMHSLIESAEMGDKKARAEFVERFMEIARRVAAEAPGARMSRYSDMAERIVTIRRQQASGERPGVSTGIPALDPYVPSIMPGYIFVHCAFSGRGKTQSLVRSSIESYKAGDNGIFYSLEMDADEIWEMFDAEAAKLSRKAIMRRDLGESDYGAYEEAAARVRAASNDIVVVDDVHGAPTVDKLAGMIERYNPDTVAVDYISLMQSTLKASSDWERVKTISAQLKALARSSKVKLYVAAQNSKDAALNGPTEDNIAFSSAIFNDCNVMVGWHQTGEWATMDKMQGRLLKNRRGEKGPPGDSGYYEFYEHWDRDRMQMEPWTPAHEWSAKGGAS